MEISPVDISQRDIGLGSGSIAVVKQNLQRPPPIADFLLIKTLSATLPVLRSSIQLEIHERPYAEMSLEAQRAPKLSTRCRTGFTRKAAVDSAFLSFKNQHLLDKGRHRPDLCTLPRVWILAERFLMPKLQDLAIDGVYACGIFTRSIEKASKRSEDSMPDTKENGVNSSASILSSPSNYLSLHYPQMPLYPRISCNPQTPRNACTSHENALHPHHHFVFASPPFLFPT